MDIMKYYSSITSVPKDSKRDVLQQLCVACLCDARKPKTLTQPALIKYYKGILRDVERSSSDSVISPRFCWECEALLKRALHFTKQVQESYLTLQTSLVTQDTFADLAKKFIRTPRTQCSIVELIDIPSHDDGLVSNDMDRGGLALNETGIENGPAPIITRIEGHAHLYKVPAKEELQEEAKGEFDNEDEEYGNEIIPVEVTVVKEEVLEDHHNTEGETFNNQSYTFQDMATASNSVKNETIKTEQPEDCIDYSCNGCSEAFTSRDELKQHIADFNIYPHFGNQYDKCQSQLINESTSQRLPTAGYRPPTDHAIRSGLCTKASDKKALHCMLCQKGFDCSSELGIHLISHVSENSCECPVCSKTLSSRAALRVHLRRHTGERPFECAVCQMTSRTKAALRDHMWTHSTDRPFKCTTCRRGFATNAHYAAHMRIHTEVNPYQCKICHKIFATGSYLILHTKIKHTTDCKTHQCKICQKEFATTGGLKEHMSRHNDEKPYHCSICQKRFRANGDLRIHARIHTGEKPYKCDICEKEFGRKEILKSHMTIHTGQKPFTCSVCQRGCSHRRDLKIHMRVHTGEKPFECTVCQRRFARSTSLKYHMKVHGS